MTQYYHAVETQEDSLLSTHKVLRNTYFMLALTLLFTTVTAIMSLYFNIPRLPFLLHLAVSIGLLVGVYMTRNSMMGLVFLFGFTGYFGLMIGSILEVYFARFSNAGSLVAMASGTTAFAFISLSAIALKTRKDFSYLRNFLFAGLIIVIAASLLNYFFFQLSALSLVVSIVTSLIMCGYILHDTSRIIHGEETNYITATVSMYLNIINLFLSLLRIFGILGGDD